MALHQTPAGQTMSAETSTLQALLERARALPAEKQRVVAALLGACVADAATRPMVCLLNSVY